MKTYYVTSLTRSCLVGVTAILAVVLTGCAGQSPSTAGSSAAPESTVAPAPSLNAHFVSITARKAGGIAGLNDAVIIDGRGVWTHTDKAGKQTRGMLTAEQTAQLVTLAANPQLTDESRRPQKTTTCNDAFSYAITIDETTVAWVDCQADGALPAAAMQIADFLGKAKAL